MRLPRRLWGRDSPSVLKTSTSAEQQDMDLDIEFDVHLGIAHTRWATHGEPSPINSHPQRSDKNNGECELEELCAAGLGASGEACCHFHCLVCHREGWLDPGQWVFCRL